MTEVRVWGIVAEFASSDAAAAVARRLYLNGFRRIDAYTPYPVPELGDVIHPRRRNWVPILIFLGALLGAFASFLLQYWGAALDYPVNVGGRPLNSWPAFTVSSFELTVLCGVATGFFALLLFCRLPRLYHPVFNTPDFERASQDRFFLSVEASDPWFDAERLREIFERHDAARISLVPS